MKTFTLLRTNTNYDNDRAVVSKTEYQGINSWFGDENLIYPVLSKRLASASILLHNGP